MKAVGASLALVCAFTLVLCTPAIAKEPLWSQTVSGEYITDVAISGDGSRVVVGTTMGGISLYDREGTLCWTKRYKGTMQVGISPDASLVIAGESESREKDKGTLRAYDRDGVLLWMAHTGWICGCGVSGDLGRIGVGNRLGQLVVYDREGSEMIWEDNLLKRYDAISAAGMSADGRFMAYSLLEKTPAVYLLNIDTRGTRTIRSAFREHGSPVHTLVLSGNGSVVLAAAGEGSTDAVYCFSNRGVLQWKKNVPHILDMEVSSDGRASIIGSEDGCIRVFDPSGNLSWTRCMEGAVQSLARSPDGDLLAAGSGGGRVLLMYGNGTPVWEYHVERFPSAGIDTVAISSRGDAIVAVVNRKEVLFFSTPWDQAAVPPPPPDNPVEPFSEPDKTPPTLTPSISFTRGQVQSGYWDYGNALRMALGRGNERVARE